MQHRRRQAIFQASKRAFNARKLVDSQSRTHNNKVM